MLYFSEIFFYIKIIGHTLIIPKHHHPDFLTLPPRLQQACWFVAGRARMLLKAQVELTDYTLCVAGGPAVLHTHLSLKPA